MVAGNLNKYRRFAKSLLSFAIGYFIPCETVARGYWIIFGESCKRVALPLGRVARGLPRYYERGNFRYFRRMNINEKVQVTTSIM
jgi:hypothetical protein